MKNDINDMKDFIKDAMADFGAEIEFDADASLSKYKKGGKLTLGELKQMRMGEVVWVTYRKDGERGLRINGPYKIESVQPWKSLNKNVSLWGFGDGSSFACDFYPDSDSKDSEQCSKYDYGEFLIWKVK